MVVTEQIIMPRPIDSKAIMIISTGTNNIQTLKPIVALPIKLETTHEIINKTICIIREIKLVITVVIGIIRRGKYTFLNKWALLTKVFDIELRQCEKYSHVILEHK